jgi:hypothetical protein
MVGLPVRPIPVAALLACLPPCSSHRSAEAEAAGARVDLTHQAVRAEISEQDKNQDSEANLAQILGLPTMQGEAGGIAWPGPADVLCCALCRQAAVSERSML